MNKRLPVLLLFLLVFPGQVLLSQQKDAGIWLSVNLEKKITPAFSFLFTEEIRINENITEAGTVFSDIGLEYRFLKRFKIAVDYRFASKRRLNDTYNTRSSYYFDFTYREKLKPVTLLFRARIQSVREGFYTSSEGKTPHYYLRTRLTAKIDATSHIRPYAYAEAFFRLDNPEKMPFVEARYCTGVEYTFNRIHMVDLFYMIRQEYNVPDPRTDFILGIGYFFTFPDFKSHRK
jgi:hypothetical protein